MIKTHSHFLENACQLSKVTFAAAINTEQTGDFSTIAYIQTSQCSDFAIGFIALTLQC